MDSRILSRFLSVTLLLALIAPGGLGATVPPWGEDEGLLETIVRDVYSKYEHYATPKVHFSLSRFSTLYPEDFASYRLLDVVTLPGGEIIDGNPVEYVNGLLLPETVEYQVEWALEKEDLLLSQPGGELIQAMSLDEALQLAAEDDRDFSGALALSTFDVTVTLEGEVRVYRAAFLWLWADPIRQTGLAMIVLDGITDDVDQVAKEDKPAGGPIAVVPEPSACTCTPTTVIDEVGQREDDSTEHSSGSHYLDVKYKRICKCDAECKAGLDWEKVKSKCADTGGNGWLRSHKTKMKGKVMEGHAPCGQVANGKVAYSCAVSSCPLGIFCRGVTITVTIPLTSQGQAGAANFSYSGGTTIWEFEWEVPGACGPCGGEGPATAG